MGSGNCHGNRTNLWIGWEVITTEGENCSKELASKVTGLAKKCRNTCHYVLVRKADTRT